MIVCDFSKTPLCPLSKRRIDEIIKTAARHEPAIKGRLEVNVVNDQAMKNINRMYRGINAATDVLSFAWRDDKRGGEGYLGQIFISWPRVKKQAGEFKVLAREEFARVLVHGLLHLVGYDHDTVRAERRMVSAQQSILHRI